MKRLCSLMAAGMLAMSSTSASHLAAGLAVANYVEVGDTIVDMLDTSGLAFSTLLLGRADTAPVRRAAFSPLTPTPRSQPFEAPCPAGGSVSGRAMDRDASGDLSVQDRFVTVFKNCGIDQEVVTGSSEFTITAHRDEGPAEVTELEFRFRDLGTEALRWTGPAKIVLRSDRRTGSEHYVVSYRDLVVTRSQHTYRWNFRLEVHRPPLGNHTASVDGSMGIGRTLLRLAQDDVFVLAPDGAPRSGQLTATDAEGNRLQVEAGRWRYSYRFFSRANRGDSPDSASQSKAHPGR